MNDKYIINDLDGFTNSARTLVFNTFGKETTNVLDDFDNLINKISKEDQAEMNVVLTQNESLQIVKDLARKQTNKKTKDTRYLIDEKLFSEILEALNARLISNILSNLTKKGLVESAYDAELDDFIFWIKEDANTTQQEQEDKPETD
jgi:hypothetical protein